MLVCGRNKMWVVHFVQKNFQGKLKRESRNPQIGSVCFSPRNKHGTSLPTETLTTARTLCKLKVRASHGVLDDPTASNEDAAALLQHCAHLGVLHFSWTHAAGCP